MGDIRGVFRLPQDSKLFGVAVKGDSAPTYIVYVYKCSVKHFECEVQYMYTHTVPLFLSLSLPPLFESVYIDEVTRVYTCICDTVPVCTVI